MEKFTPPVSFTESKEIAPQEQTSPASSPSGNVVTNLPDPTRYGDWERKGKCVDF